MPPYGSLHSPSLRKMEHSRSYRRRGIQLGNILGDPFALATISISLVCAWLPPSPTTVRHEPLLCERRLIVSQLAWFITFVSCIIAQIQATDPADKFPTFAWWAAVYSLFLIAGVFVVVASDSIHTYHVAVTGYLSGGMVLVTSSVNSLLYSKNGAREAAAAGFILLSMVVVSANRPSLMWWRLC